ncbi:hypothetical protein BH11MYX4_BH11MYX4_49730 [soil metagenome]
MAPIGLGQDVEFLAAKSAESAAFPYQRLLGDHEYDPGT